MSEEEKEKPKTMVLYSKELYDEQPDLCRVYLRFLTDSFIFEFTGTDGLFPELIELYPENTPPDHKYYVLTDDYNLKKEIYWDYCLDKYHWRTAEILLKIIHHNEKKQNERRVNTIAALNKVIKMI